jgi:hypothetical protein
MFFCPACGWDDLAWGADFWQRHVQDGERREPGLPCVDGGRLAEPLRYRLEQRDGDLR